MTMRPKRPDFLTGMTPAEKGVIENHKEYARRLSGEGRIIPGGAATGGTIGIIDFAAATAAEAEAIYRADPAVTAGIGYTGLHPFRTGMRANRRKGCIVLNTITGLATRRCRTRSGASSRPPVPCDHGAGARPAPPGPAGEDGPASRSRWYRYPVCGSSRSTGAAR
jgi:uncharacterized protein YciI